ncbi:DUF5719 family protein [Leucobacter allii]|uniref:DUF5719 family protein n=1 Tax=Leucobacter allii TaxID=2932247 RepID=A0ABY4FIW3_9MICO|nr:DUF5719 family protein [Leucobacter allii]UOQ56458.1 DUF5719 family protein [Leucobacter allii]
MSERSRILRGGARAVTGLAVVAVSAAAVALIGSATLPAVATEPPALAVDTTQNTQRTLVCAGAFAELGGDAARANVAVPTGAPAVALSGTASESAALARPEGGDGLPAVFSAPAAEPIGAAQLQQVSTETLRGAVASSCAEPLNEQWLLGGASTLGISTTLSLGNAGTVPATVQLTVYDENGEVVDDRMSGVLVAPGSEQIVSLNGYAPDRERLAVRVESTGAPVTASLGVGQTSGIEPWAVSTVNRQAEPETRLVIPGIANVSDHVHGPSDSGEGDEIPVVVRALAPGEAGGVATVRAIDREGASTELGAIDLAPGVVGELQITTWPKGATTVIVDADVPVLAAVQGTASEDDETDNEWFTPANRIPADTPTAAPVVGGGRLVLANPGDEAAEVTIASASGNGKTRTVDVPAGASVLASAPADAVLTSSAPVHAGVRYLTGGDLAGYPILAPDPRDGELTVYTR